jgi:hypothetical protein
VSLVSFDLGQCPRDRYTFLIGAERQHVVHGPPIPFSEGERNVTPSQSAYSVCRRVVDSWSGAGPIAPDLETNITLTQWSNPASGNSGFIKLGKKLTRKKQQCEEIEYTVRSGGTPVYTEHYHFTSCLQPDGAWKIA